MYGSVKSELAATLAEIRSAGLFKGERLLTTPQAAHIRTAGGDAANFCANNYLGLADHPEVITAARSALDEWGFGMASVRFICGTQTLHKSLERALSGFLGTDDTILYPSSWRRRCGDFRRT